MLSNKRMSTSLLLESIADRSISKKTDISRFTVNLLFRTALLIQAVYVFKGFRLAITSHNVQKTLLIADRAIWEEDQARYLTNNYQTYST